MLTKDTEPVRWMAWPWSLKACRAPAPPPVPVAQTVTDDKGQFKFSKIAPGKYIVVEHQWDGCPYYSLYGHLRSIAVQIGQKVSQGEHLAVMFDFVLLL